MLDNIEKVKGHLVTGKNTLLTIAGVAGAFVVIAGAVAFLINNYYKPKKDLKVVTVDYDKGEATVKFKNDTIHLVGDATWSLTGQWGIKFGSKNDGKYDNIEITQSGMVYDYLDQRKTS